jgi:hypothetical protein
VVSQSQAVASVIKAFLSVGLVSILVTASSMPSAAQRAVEDGITSGPVYGCQERQKFMKFYDMLDTPSVASRIIFDLIKSGDCQEVEKGVRYKVVFLDRAKITVSRVSFEGRGVLWCALGQL